ncbi:MAG: protein kinase [Oscillospiraceae bacterium]
MEITDLIKNTIVPQIKQPIWESWYIKDVEHPIGSGSFSVVYEVEARRESRTDRAALKVEAIIADRAILDADKKKSAIDRKKASAESETGIMIKLRDCPYIVGYQDEYIGAFHDADGNFQGYYNLIRMELLGNVGESIYSGKFQCSEENVKKLAVQIGEGLKFAHDTGVIHRDVKPENLFVSENGIFKLGDFNISKKADLTCTYAGSPNYMAPEVYAAKTDSFDSYTSQADIYSLGICLYQMMNDGLFPLESDTCDMDNAYEKRMKGEAFPPPCKASDEFAKIIMKACAFSVDERYSSMDEMLDDLRSISRIKTYRPEQPVDANATVYAEGGNSSRTPSQKANSVSNASNATVFSESPTNNGTAGSSAPKKKPIGIIAGVIAVIVILSAVSHPKSSSPEVKTAETPTSAVETIAVEEATTEMMADEVITEEIIEEIPTTEEVTETIARTEPFYATKVDEIPEDMKEKMKNQAQDSFISYRAGLTGIPDWQGTIAVPDAEFLGYYFLTEKEGFTSTPHNDLYLIYKYSADIFALKRGGNGVDKEQGNETYYFYYRYSDIQIMPDGTCTVDLSSGRICDKTSESDYGYQNLIPCFFFFKGYPDIDSLFNECVATKVEKYQYENTVEENAGTAEETPEESSGDAPTDEDKIYLSDMELFANEGTGYSTATYLMDNYKNEYRNSVSVDKGYVSYLVKDMGCSSFHGTVALPKDVSPDSHKTSAQLEIFVDDVLVFRSETFTSESKPQEFNIDITNAEVIKLSWSCEGSTYSKDWCYYATVFEPYISKASVDEFVVEGTEKEAETISYLSNEDLFATDSKKIYTNEKLVTNYNEKYLSSFSIDKGYASFLVKDRGFVGFTGIVALPKDVTPDRYKTSAQLDIYVDEELVFRSETFTSESKPQEFNIDITGAEVVKVIWNCDGSTYSKDWAYYATIFDGYFYSASAKPESLHVAK